MIRPFNACWKKKARITANLRHRVEKLGGQIPEPWRDELDVLFVFSDFDPCYGGNANAFHEYGADGSAIFVQVDTAKIMPSKMIFWVACHEFRHFIQSIKNKFCGPKYDSLLKALLAREGLTQATPEFMIKYHDQFPEEVDADTWANTYCGWDGAKWWKNVLVTRKPYGHQIKDYQL